MITIKDFMESIQYKVTDGAEYCWQSYGPNAYSLNHWNGRYDDGVTVSIVFDTITAVVYEMQAWDYANKREYRWIHPDYLEAHMAESKLRNVDFNESIDDSKFIDLDVADDILEKATAIIKGEEYDTRVMVPLQLDDDQLLQLMTLAHEADQTLNEYVEQIMRFEIAKAELLNPVWPPAGWDD